MKTTTAVCIDTDVMAEIRLRQIKLSSLVNSYLRAYLSLSEKVKTNKTELTKENLRLTAELEKVKEQQALILSAEAKEKKDYENSYSLSIPG